MAKICAVAYAASCMVGEAMQIAGQPSAPAKISLPPNPENFPVLPRCASDKLSDWAARVNTTAAFLDAWKSKRPSAGIVQADGEDSCLLAGRRPSKDANVALSLVKNPEEELCNVKEELAQNLAAAPANSSFTVFGNMATRAPSRRYQVIMPTGRKCEVNNKCPVLMFFHGCGRNAMPHDQFVFDSKCGANLESVVVLPWLDDENERWTLKGEALHEFVVPLTKQLLKAHPELDGDRVTVAGASLGSGMAMQAGLLHPDLFSAVVAGGLADGSHCAGDDPTTPAVPFDAKKLPSAAAIPTVDSQNWKLKSITIIMGEKELFLDEKVTAILDVLDESKVSEKVGLHMRLYGDANHPQCSIMGFNQWQGLHQFFWGQKA